MQVDVGLHEDSVRRLVATRYPAGFAKVYVYIYIYIYIYQLDLPPPHKVDSGWDRDSYQMT